MSKVYLVYICFDDPRGRTFTKLANIYSSRKKATDVAERYNADPNKPDGFYYTVEESNVY